MRALLLSLAPLLGCGLMMLVCVGAFSGFRRRSGPAPEPASQEEVAALRDEVARLRAERRADEARSADG